MMRSALLNSAGFDKCVMSPVWIMNAGFTGSDLTLPIASSSVPITFGLAGLSEPPWLALICRKVSLPASAARAPSTIPSERGTPPAIVHNTPVPAQVMHSNTFRRLMPAVPTWWDPIGASPLSVRTWDQAPQAFIPVPQQKMPSKSEGGGRLGLNSYACGRDVWHRLGSTHWCRA